MLDLPAFTSKKVFVRTDRSRAAEQAGRGRRVFVFLNPQNQRFADGEGSGKSTPSFRPNLGSWTLGQCSGKVRQSRWKPGQCFGKAGQFRSKLRPSSGEVSRCAGKLGPSDGKVRQCAGKLRPSNGKVRQCAGKVRPSNGKVSQCSGKPARCNGKVRQCVWKPARCNWTCSLSAIYAEFQKTAHPESQISINQPTNQNE